MAIYNFYTVINCHGNKGTITGQWPSTIVIIVVNCHGNKRTITGQWSSTTVIIQWLIVMVTKEPSQDNGHLQ
jgi:hypothetical protein